MFQRKYLNFQKIKTTPILLKIQIALKLFKVEGNTQFFMFYFEIQIFKRVSKEILEFFFFFFKIKTTPIFITVPFLKIINNCSRGLKLDIREN